MNNVVQIKRPTFLKAYVDAENARWIPDWIVIAIGITITMVLPQIFLGLISGILLVIAFGACAVFGTSLGLIIYSRFPYRIDSCVPSEERKNIASTTVKIPKAA